MAYDRYVAICNPLLYNVIMSQRLCHVLVGITYLYSTFQALLFPVKYFTSTFCGSKVISHFYCDVVPLLPMICSDAQETELLTILFSAFNLISSLLVVLVSYLLILLAIFRMHSAEGRKKAFSMCGSHLTVVVVFYGSLLFIHLFSAGQLRHIHPHQDGVIRHLAFIELGNSTVICPKMLVNFVVDRNTISHNACATQLAFFLVFIISEFFILSAMAYDRYVAICNPLLYNVTMSQKLCHMLMACFILFIISELSILSVMAYDRYVAICNPLLYNVIMSQRLCHVLVGITYLYSTFQALLFPVKYFTSTFCGSKVISHFYCDVVPLLPMICSDAQETELLMILFSAFNLISSLLVVLVSYLLILLAIFRMHSAEGRKKAFSTCGSHLTVVVVFYGSLLFMYVQPKSSHSYETDKLASVFYTLVIPMLNPLIYSLRNKEVNNAFQRVLKNHCKMAFFITFIISELFILSTMAYDRYVAICNPLLYNVIMSQRRCHVLVGIPYLYSIFQALMITIKIFILTFCGSNVISHFYCDDVPLLLMLCSNARDIELLIILFSAFNLFSSLMVILVSYLLILLAICRMHSAEGRKKAFSTCGSHLTVVVVFYGSLLFMYVQPKSTHSFETDKLASVFYTLVIPMLNPLIYSVRNKE
ncbi:Hypothetical predicted protein, partial [Marmota monax]